MKNAISDVKVKTIKFKKLNPKAEIPTYAHDGDIGLDVKAVSLEYDIDNDVYIYGTGLACETEGHMGVLGMMKSGIYKKGDCYLTNAVGLIDSDQYRGEIKYIYRNRVSIRHRAMYATTTFWYRQSLWYRLTHNFTDIFARCLNDLKKRATIFAPYQVGDVCGQLVPLTFDTMKIEEVEELSETERGTGGFGSTDIKKNTTSKKKTKNSSNSSKMVKDK